MHVKKGFQNLEHLEYNFETYANNSVIKISFSSNVMLFWH